MRTLKNQTELALILALFFLADPVFGAVPVPPANLRILNPGITDQTDDQTVFEGESATFAVTAVGDDPLSYQWTFDGTNVGLNTNSYTRVNCRIADNGGRIRVTVTNGGGTVRSREVTLSVYPAGKNYYVAANGSSANTGLSTNSPWSLTYAVTKLGPGITLTLMPGLYNGQYSVSGKSGTAGNPGTIRSQQKWKAVLANSTGHELSIWQCNYLVIDGLSVSNAGNNGIDMKGANNTIRNCWIVNNAHHGINDSNAANSNNVVENCLIELSGGGVWAGGNNFRPYGIYLSGANNIIRNNVFRHNGYAGIHFYTEYAECWQNNCRIYNNLVYGHTNGAGIIVWSDTDPLYNFPGTNYVTGNTLLDGIQVALGQVCISNNIILPIPGAGGVNIANNARRPAVVVNDCNLSTKSFNSSGAAQGPHDVVTNYLGFVDPGNGLYWLTSDSPARGKASSIVFSSTDFFGNRQTIASDIGAFQYDPARVNDNRVLDPSPANPDYWERP